MAQLVVRRLEQEVVRELRARAARAEVSMEEAHRRILRAALLGRGGKVSFREHLFAMPSGGDDTLFDRKRTTGRGTRAR